MTLNGWLQILFFLLAIFARDAARSAATWRGCSRASARGSIRCCGPLERLDLPADRRRRDARDALDRVRGRAAAVQRRLDAGAVRDAAAAAACCRSTRRASARCAPDLAFNTAASFTTNTNWQAYGGEIDDELLHADGRPRVPQLRVGGGRHRGRDRVHPRHRRRRRRTRSATSGSTWSRASLWVLLPISHRRRAVPRLAGRRAEPQAVRQGAVIDPQTVTTTAPTASRSRVVASRRSRRARSRRRRSSSSSAPTAAASSTPTARIRSRTRRR